MALTKIVKWWIFVDPLEPEETAIYLDDSESSVWLATPVMTEIKPNHSYTGKAFLQCGRVFIPFFW